ncbi:SDR family oxidoreductase [Moorena sp. SIO3H5]|uniref:SDR family oxidoreductase n=1 Tax=Moorena sp. SIO3H5 TaxID=2607834 RepID=UPI0013BCB0C1|nr:SDR family oxidoreductase [Moorena sp. SIO3H5]NEO73715.1 SDR family oxidoreductase [Moorena sp. SIO3H5]
MSKTILITGASSGIGKATAKLFQEKGWNVVATMRTPEKETELTTLDNVLVTRLDVLEQDSITKAVQLGIEKFDKIDVLVNNAGYGAYGLLEATPREKIIRQFDVNVIGLLDVTKAILPHFRQNKDGILINISSIGGKMTFPLFSLYNGTKFAVEGISEGLSFELQAIGCKVKIIEPGVINTDFAGRSLDMNNDENLTEYQELIGKLFNSMESLAEQASEPIVVANVIYEAATDGTDKLRYTAGEDARMMVANRKELDDKTFIQGIKEQFSI